MVGQIQQDSGPMTREQKESHYFLLTVAILGVCPILENDYKGKLAR